MRTEQCEHCPDEDTEKCIICQTEHGPEEMKLTYTFVIREGITQIEGLQNDLDLMVKCAGLELVNSTLESPDEESEHDFREE